MEIKNVPAEEVKKTEAEEKQVEKSQEEETVTLKKSEVDSMLTAVENATKVAESKTKAAKDLTAGIDKYKRMLKDNGIDDEEEKPQGVSEERIAQIVKETIEKTIPQVVKPKEDDELTIANNKIAEMRVAMANGGKKVPSALGSNLDGKDETQKTEAEKFFSADQIAEIKRKFPNADIEQIYKNLPKGDEMKGKNA